MQKHYKIIGTALIIISIFSGCNQQDPQPIEPNSEIPAEQAVTEPQTELPIAQASIKPSSNSTEDLMKQLFSIKYDNKPLSEISITIMAEDSTHVSGGVSFSPNT